MERAFLEREREMKALGDLLGGVRRAGSGVLVLVAGEAGVGKTTLVRRFAGAIEAPRVLWGICDPLTTPAPLAPVIEIAAELDAAAAAALERGARPQEVGRALAADLADNPASVVVLEDLHWADDGTLDVLLHLARRIERIPALVVGTYREGGSSLRLRTVLGVVATAPQVERLAPAPLSRSAVGALADETGHDGDAVFAATGGNPFFVSELLAAAPGDDVPVTVRDAVLARVAQLDDEARALLELVSVVPPETEDWLLDGALGQARAALERCLADGILERRADGVSYRHELARLAVEQSLGPERTAHLHRRVLGELERTGAEPARLAHHAEGARDAAALLRHATAAGARSAELGAHREAAEQYARALSVAAELPDAERAELLSRYAFERYLTDRLDDAIAAQREAVELRRRLGDELAEGDALRLLSRFLWFGGRNEEAAAAADEAVGVLERLPDGVALARAYSNVSQLRMLAYDAPAAIEWGTRALALAERLTDAQVVVHALANVGSAEVLAGRDGPGRAKLEQSLAQALELDLQDDAGRAYANLASQATERRQFALAARYLAEGIAYCEEHDLLSYELYLRAWSSRLALDSGRWRSAAELAAQVTRHPQASPPTRIVGRVVAGLLAIRTGDRASGEALLDEALAAAAPTGELQRLAPVAAARAEAAWLREDPEAVDRETATVAALAAERAQPWLLGDLLVWRHRAGLPVLDGTVPPPYAAELEGDHARAAAIWTDLGCPHDAALALAAAPDERALRRSLTELQRLGAVPASRIVARRLRRLGARAIPRGPYRAARENPARLTARELEVLALLAERLSNREIARRLVVSPRTVDHHVSRVLAKLGVANRGDAVAAANRLGLVESR